VTAPPRRFADPATVRLLVLDVDGVLTDGSIMLDDTGRELKRFHARDGVGLRVWGRLGFSTAIITGRVGGAVRHRMAELGITELIMGARDKEAPLRDLALRTGVPPAEMAFVGDDWPDLAPMSLVGYPIAVADATAAVRQAAALVTAAPGGRGAVREAVEHLLVAKGLLGTAIGVYWSGAGPVG